jgi:hypothetical protein
MGEEPGAVSTEGRLSHAEIRRALAECMTLANIDEAMDWKPGTARHRRWSTGPDRLPFADAELAGVPLWFRSTIEAWQASQPEPEPEPEPDLDDEDDETEDDQTEDDETEDVTEDEPEEADADAEDVTEAEGPEEQSDPRSVQSGFELRTGQRVTANIHGRWRDAVVTHRDRATVAVDYNLDDTPHGMRRQRISVSRIRLPDAD